MPYFVASQKTNRQLSKGICGLLRSQSIAAAETISQDKFCDSFIISNVEYNESLTTLFRQSFIIFSSSCSRF